MAVAEVMSFELSPARDKATTVKMTYTIGGYTPGGLDKIAPMADTVLGRQLDGPKAAAERRRRRRNSPALVAARA